MPNLRAILFDLDDTLYPEMDYVASGFCAVAAWTEQQWNHNPEESFAEFTRLAQSPPRNNVFNRWLLSRHENELGRSNEMVEVYREHRPTIALATDVVGLLDRLRARFRLGVVTDGWHDVQQRKIEALNLTAYVDTIVISDQWGPTFWKPHPRPYLAALERLACKAEETIFVGDNLRKDFLGARRVGLRSIRVCRAGGIYADEVPLTPEHEPDHCVDSLVDIEPLLSSVNTD